MSSNSREEYFSCGKSSASSSSHTVHLYTLSSISIRVCSSNHRFYLVAVKSSRNITRYEPDRFRVVKLVRVRVLRDVAGNFSFGVRAEEGKVSARIEHFHEGNMVRSREAFKFEHGRFTSLEDFVSRFSKLVVSTVLSDFFGNLRSPGVISDVL